MIDCPLAIPIIDLRWPAPVASPDRGLVVADHNYQQPHCACAVFSLLFHGGSRINLKGGNKLTAMFLGIVKF